MSIFTTTGGSDPLWMRGGPGSGATAGLETGSGTEIGAEVMGEGEVGVLTDIGLHIDDEEVELLIDVKNLKVYIEVLKGGEVTVQEKEAGAAPALVEAPVLRDLIENF